MRDYLRVGDFKNLELQAHSLKGSAAHVSAHGLQKAALEIEVGARKQEMNILAPLIAHVESDYLKFKEVVADVGFSDAAPKEKI